MYTKIFKNPNKLSILSPRRINVVKNKSNLYELETYQDELLKTKIELNKRNIECNELRKEYKILYRKYTYNVYLMEQLLKGENINTLNNSPLNRIKRKKALIEFEYTNKHLSPKNHNHSKILESSHNSINEITTSKNNNLYISISSHILAEKLKKEIVDLKNELKEKEDIIDELKEKSNVIKYRELDNKYSKVYKDFIQIREKNEKLELYCSNCNSKINLYKEKIKKEIKKFKQLENENDYLRRKIDSISLSPINLSKIKNLKHCEKIIK
jgi:uncharacterized protein (DUF3084 family)